MTAKASRKLIKEWNQGCQVGIYENCSSTIRLYSDRAIVRAPYVKWVGNSGNLADSCERITGQRHRALLELATQEVEDSADYTGQAMSIVCH